MTAFLIIPAIASLALLLLAGLRALVHDIQRWERDQRPDLHRRP